MARRTKKTADLAVELTTEPVQYQVIRPLRISASTTLPIGARITPNDSWPHRRAKQFVDQGFLIPVPPNSVQPDTPVEPDPFDDTGAAGDDSAEPQE